MNAKKIAGILCMVLAAISLAPAISVISNTRRVVSDSGDALGQSIGALLPVIGLLILGLWLYQKGSQN